jgi:hypothetical protein
MKKLMGRFLELLVAKAFRKRKTVWKEAIMNKALATEAIAGGYK